MSVIVSLMGGLGFFLYGMKLMSEGLQKVAGSKMRSILEVFTKNRVIGLLVGIFFTALIQSSNATTVMVVSFVNSWNYPRSKHRYDGHRTADRV